VADDLSVAQVVVLGLLSSDAHYHKRDKINTEGCHQLQVMNKPTLRNGDFVYTAKQLLDHTLEVWEFCPLHLT